MNQIKLERHHDDIINNNLVDNYFVQYTINGDICTYSASIKEINERLNKEIGKGKFRLYHE